MESPKEHQEEETKHESTFSLIDGMVTVLEEEEELLEEERRKKEEEEEEADSSHFSVGGDNGW